MFRPIRFGFLLAAAAAAVVLLVSACTSGGAPATSAPTPGVTRLGRLTPFVAVSATPSPTATVFVTPTIPPSPTSTPRTHVVKLGEDLGGIAYLYKVTVPDLIEANPTVNPHAMSVGLTLIIPPSKTSAAPAGGAEGATNFAEVTPTPLPLESGLVACQRGQDGGVWCFMPVYNNHATALEGVSASFQINSAGQEPIQSTAYLPLDVLPPGVTLPLVAHFPPQQAKPLTQPLSPSSQMISALPSADDGRYTPAHIEDAQVRIAPDGLSAGLSMKVKLDIEGASASRVWVAAVAYDAEGNITGVRRWENTSASPLESGKALEVSFTIYSVAEKIERVDLFPEARP